MAFGLYVVGTVMLEDELSLLRAAGEPVTIAEAYDRRAPVPDEQNSALILLAVADQLTTAIRARWLDDLPIIGRGELPPLGEPMPPEMQKNLAAYFQERAELISRLMTLRDRPRGRFPCEWKQHGRFSYPRGPMYACQAARLLQAYTVWRAYSGDMDAAADALRAAWNCGGAIGDEPRLDSYQLRTATEAQAVAVLERIMACGPLANDDLLQCAAVLDATQDNELLAGALRGQRAYVYELWRAKPAECWRERLCWTVWSGWVKLNQRRMLRYWGEMIEVASQSGYAAQLAADELEHAPREWSNFYWMARLWSLTPTDQWRMFSMFQAVFDSARAGIALERYHRAHNGWPATLDVLVPEYLPAVPEDPFDGQPMRFERTDGGCVVYSIGRDGVDDGGNVGSPWRESPPDLGFRLLDPERRLAASP